MEEKSISPVPRKVNKINLLTFPDAIREILNGRKVTRVEWNNQQIYCLLQDTFLTIHIHEEFKRWIVNDGDMTATDWVVLPEGN